MEGTAQTRAELKHAMVDLHDDDRRVTDKVGWFDWMNLDIEEHAELERKERLKNVPLSFRSCLKSTSLQDDESSDDAVELYSSTISSNKSLSLSFLDI
jgi:hypothetical protein